MKSISIWQPWASLIATDRKRYETRSWSISYRGLIAIHAAKKWTREQENEACQIYGVMDAAELPSLPLGVVVCVADLVACHSTDSPSFMRSVSRSEQAVGNFSPRRFAWELTNVTPLKCPLAYRGMQGLFNVSTALIEAAL